MTSGNEIDSYVTSTSRALGMPLIVSRNLFAAMQKAGANTDGLKANGYLAVAAVIDVQHVPTVGATKGADGVWRVPVDGR